jgi:uncharacterized membrane protein
MVAGTPPGGKPMNRRDILTYTFFLRNTPRGRGALAASALALLGLTTSQVAAACRAYTFTTIDVSGLGTGSHDTQVNDINDAGVMIGTYQDATNASHGFMYSGGVFTKIDSPSAGTNTGACGANATGTAAHGINNKGAIVGNYFDTGCNQHGFRYIVSTGTYTTIDDPNASAATGGTYASDINDSGTVAGYYVDAGGQAHGFLEIDGFFATVNNQIASPAGLVALDINNSNVIVGLYFDNHSIGHGYKIVDGVLSTVDDPSGTLQNVANKITEKGVIVGSYEDSTHSKHGFVDSGGFCTIDDPNATTATDVEGMNRSGTIVGAYIDAAGHHGFMGKPQ